MVLTILVALLAHHTPALRSRSGISYFSLRLRAEQCLLLCVFAWLLK